MLDADDLGPADEKLLDMLRGGRVTAPYAAEETGYSLQYVRDRLGRLVEHGNAKKVYEGLYELVEDPREDQPARPYTWDSVEAARQFIAGVEERIEMVERGEIEGDAEQLREDKEAIEARLEEILKEVDSDGDD